MSCSSLPQQPALFKLLNGSLTRERRARGRQTGRQTFSPEAAVAFVGVEAAA